MAASLTQLLGGTFQDCNGSVLAYGYLTLKLSQDGNVSGVGNICSGVTITIQLDANGNVGSSTSPTPVADQYVWANSNISPINTYYKVTGYTQGGQRAFGPNNQQVAAGATFNVGTWVPNSVISWFPEVQQSLLLEVNGVAASSQTVQNLESTDDTVVITDLGGGNINFQSAGSTTKFPGQWLGFNIAGAIGNSLSEGAEIGASFIVTNANSLGNQNPTATEGRYIPLSSAGSSNSGGIGDQNLDLSLGILQDWLVKVNFQGLTSSRYWIGVTDQLLVNTQTIFPTDTPAANFVGFRWSSGTDTDIVAVCQTDSTHQTVVSTGVVPSSNQILEIVPVSGGSPVVFKINGAQVASISTNIPAASVALGSILCNDDKDDILGSDVVLGIFYLYFLLAN